jgi:hypothetical protein
LLQKAGRDHVAAFIYFNISPHQMSTPHPRGLIVPLSTWVMMRLPSFPPSQFAFDDGERATVDDVRRMQGLRFIPELARR